MNIILNYVISHLDRENGNSLSKSLEVLEHMIKEKQINKNSVVLLNNEEILLKDYLKRKNEKIFSEELFLFIHKNLEIDFDIKEYVEVLIKIIKNVKLNKEEMDSELEEEEKLKKILQTFLNLHIPSQYIVQFLHKNPEKSQEFFNSLFKNSSSFLLHKIIVEDYLGFENIKKPFEDFIREKYFYFTDEHNAEKLLNNYPELRSLKDKQNITLLEHFILNNPDMLKDLNIDLKTRKTLAKFYFEHEIIDKEEPKIPLTTSLYDFYPDWFKVNCNSMNFINYIMLKKENIFVNFVLKLLKKNDDIQDFIKDSNINLLVSYISNKKSKSEKIIKKINTLFPHSFNENIKYGLLNLELKHTNFHDVPEELLKKYPSNLLLTSDEDILENFINSNCFIITSLNKFYVNKGIENLQFLNKIIKDNFKDKMSNKVYSSLDKVNLQIEINRYLKSNSYNEKNEVLLLFKKYNLTYKNLEKMKLFSYLMDNGFITKNEIMKLKVEEEKDNLKKSLVKKEDNEKIIKKRL